MKLGRLILATIISSIVMFSMSFYWHGVLLNDLMFITYDKKLFFGLLSILYVAVAGALSFFLMFYKPEENRTLKHATIGVASGFMIYLIAFVLGLSFKGEGLANTVINFTWQMIEQGIGALFISVFYTVAHRRAKLLAFEDVRDED